MFDIGEGNVHCGFITVGCSGHDAEVHFNMFEMGVCTMHEDFTVPGIGVCGMHRSSNMLG